MDNDAKKPSSDSNSFVAGFMESLGGSSQAMDKLVLAQTTDAALERTLKFLQIIYYNRLVEKGDTTAVPKKYRPYIRAIELLSEQVDRTVQAYQDKYGEL